MDQAELQALWEQANAPQNNEQILAHVGGGNLRFNAAKALFAAYHTAGACLELTKVVTTTTLTGIINPFDVFLFSSKLAKAVVTGLNALVERMNPVDYIACVVLSKNPTPIQPEDFRKQLETFCATYRDTPLPWYLGITQSSVDDLEGLLKKTSPNGFEELLERLDGKGSKWLDHSAGGLMLRQRHFTLGLEADD